ncbi:MAG: hypothetical protein HYW48_07265 [Deltaproteobacteria bacterium]|nr:hypothetical protein [Deltaproteobacteria bacterium]
MDFSSLKAQLHADIKRLLLSWLPNGKVQGGEYLALNPRRNDTHLGSFKINLSSGKWCDFATGDRGGDLISLYAFIKSLSQYKAAVELFNGNFEEK